MVRAHQVDLLTTSLGFGNGREFPASRYLDGLRGDGPHLRYEVKDQHTKRETVHLRVVGGILSEGLRRHVGRCPRRLGELHCTFRGEIEDPSDAEVGDFCDHIGGEEDVVCGEVTVDDGRGVAVKVGKTQGDVVKHGDLQVARDVGLRLDAGRQTRGQVLHNYHGCARSLFYVDAQKLHNVRVPQVAQ